ncbi:MAG: tyrosine transporter [Chlamydiia bacterium]|nr:tyrosine transporter [Chlamydiia bacterium]
MFKEGSLWGGILLLAGCCIGAGMLGLPIVTAQAGFIPTVVFFILAWLFMVLTGLILTEVNLWCGAGTNLISMSKKTLGSVGEWVTIGLFVFLFDSILVGYISGGGEIIAGALGGTIPLWLGGLILIVLFGSFVYAGTYYSDLCNRWLMVGLAISYFLLVWFGVQEVNGEALMKRDWSKAWFILPPMVISFGYHNLVPTLTAYFGADRQRLRLAVVVGALLPLIIYLLWEAVILGILPSEQGVLQQALDHGEMVTHVLKQGVGRSGVANLAEAFAFFAIVTSFLGVSLSFVDFLADGLNVKRTPKGNFLLSALVMVPPYVIAYTYPGLFYRALNYAGGFATVILFGLIPVLMMRKKGSGPFSGHLILSCVTLFALLVIALTLWNEIGK